MPTPTIIRGEDHFFTTIYEGNGGGQRVGKFVPFTDNGTIANSCIFNGATNNYLARTPSSNGSGTTLTFSCWVKRGLLGTRDFLYTGNITSISEHLLFDSSNRLQYYEVTSGSRKWDYVTNRTFEDTSKWYHIYVRRDTTDSTAADRIQIYVDGERITSFATSTQPSLNATGYWNQTTYAHNIGTTGNASYIRGIGYLAEVNMVDGSNPDVSTFGLTDTSTGRWIPKTLTGITYGTNGFRFKFQDSSALGDDTSGNGNDFTATNLASTDQTTDSPTQNHATLQGTGGTLSEGNLKLVTGNSDFSHHNATLKPKSGKYYAEFTCNAMGRSEVGVASSLNVPYASNTTRLPATSDGSVAGYMYYGYNGRVYYNSSNSYDLTYATYTTNDVIGIALDLDNHTVQFFKNNSSQGTIPLPNGNYTFVAGDGATGYGGGWTANFGQKSFSYTPPTGFVALQQDNLPTNDKGIPDFVWIKNRDATDDHQLYDTTRGVQKDLNFDAAGAEATTTDGLQKFLKGGFAIEDDVSVNTSGESYVSWNWVCNGGTTSANTSATPTIASNFQVNDTAGFSIVTYTGTGSAGTVQHGLSSAPEWIIIKERGNTNGFIVSHKGLTSQATYSVNMAHNNAEYSDAGTYYWNSTAPTSSVFSIATDSAVNRSSGTYVAWCWHSVPGFSKFSHYIGNGNADGTFIYLGFKPKFVIIKGTNASNFNLFDTARNQFNPLSLQLYADTTEVDYNLAARGPDFLSNGFKLRQEAGYGSNNDGQRYIYMAFAEHPFIGDGISPTTAV